MFSAARQSMRRLTSRTACRQRPSEQLPLHNTSTSPWIMLGGNGSGSTTTPTNNNGMFDFCFCSYSTLTKEEEQQEKDRVASLTPGQKDAELRRYDSEIARLQTLRGINTGELYTMRGRFKFMWKEYGAGFMVWYWVVWTSMAVGTYTALEVTGVDTMALIANLDTLTGYEISSRVDPELGTIGVTIAINELLEVVRIPFLVYTTKPVVDYVYEKRMM